MGELDSVDCTRRRCNAALASPPHSLTRHSSLIDSFGRVHNNLRISVTDRCNLRCVYCMPEEVVFMDRAELLTFEEIAHFVRVAVAIGDRQSPV